MAVFPPSVVCRRAEMQQEEVSFEEMRQILPHFLRYGTEIATSGL
jgi:hypothetical protein